MGSRLSYSPTISSYADMMNSASGWAEDARGAMVSRIVDSGIPVVVSEGNDGGVGLFYASTPAAGYSVTGTGAVSNTMFPAFLQRGSYTNGSNSTSPNNTKNFGFLMGTPAFAVETTLSLWSAVKTGNACQPLPDNTPDLSQKIVLLEFPDSRATQCYPNDQGANIAAKGGRFMIYYEQTNVYVAAIVSSPLFHPLVGTDFLQTLGPCATILLSMRTVL
jgi:hypothetical protein